MQDLLEMAWRTWPTEIFSSALIVMVMLCGLARGDNVDGAV